MKIVFPGDSITDADHNTDGGPDGLGRGMDAVLYEIAEYESDKTGQNRKGPDAI